MVLLGVALFLVPGCRAQTLGKDQADMRCVLLSLYEEQVMDNLIRARNLKPIVQIDYSKMTGQVDTTLRAKGNSTSADADNRIVLRPRGAPPPATAANTTAGTDTLTLALEAEATQKASLTLTGDPVIGNADLYASYMDFVNPAKRPGRLMVARCLPDDMAKVHIWRFRDGYYYWVPVTYAGEFMQLFLTTTLTRAGRSAPQYFEATLAAVADRSVVDNWKKGIGVTMRVLVSPKIPNDSGRLLVTADGYSHWLLFNEVADPDDSRMTDHLTLLLADSDITGLTGVSTSVLQGLNAAELEKAQADITAKRREVIDKFVASLAAKPARLYLDHVTPQPQKIDASLEDIRHELELLRIGGVQAR